MSDSKENEGTPQVEEQNQLPIQYQVRSRIAYITINTKMNIVSLESARKIVESLKAAEADPKVGCIVIRSTGDRIFSAGYDLTIFQHGFDLNVGEIVLKDLTAISKTILQSKKPTIAQIQASAFGAGCIMAFSCDFRIVAQRENLVFCLPEVDVKIFSGTGATVAPLYALGLNHAKDMLLTGRKVPLAEMIQWGGVTRVVPPENLEKEVKNFARELVEKTPPLLQGMKAMLNIMGFAQMKDLFDCETEMTRYYFTSMAGLTTISQDEHIKQMWQKYGTGFFE